MGGWGLSRSHARRRAAARRRAVADTLATLATVVGLALLWAFWWHVATDPGQTREDAALACARASDGADGSIADCYTVRGLPVPGDL